MWLLYSAVSSTEVQIDLQLLLFMFSSLNSAFFCTIGMEDNSEVDSYDKPKQPIDANFGSDNLAMEFSPVRTSFDQYYLKKDMSITLSMFYS